MSKRQSKKDRNADAGGVPARPGLLFILSAPSGAGKSTLCRAVRKHFPDLLYSISYTTREPRKGEQNGVDYHFISKAAFENGIARNQWAEWAEVHGNYYGTSAEFIDGGLADGRDILLDIDVQGTCRILKRYPDAITFFIMPPSLEALRRRLENRGTDSPEVIDLRLENAKQEMSCKELYRHVIVNDQLSDAVAELIGIIERYRS
ncbi:MAG: guanylate kinase [Desulfobacterales bacterium]|jgi:guanylate kinase